MIHEYSTGEWDMICLYRTCFFSSTGRGWFCRAWKGFEYKEAFSKNKFTAVKSATKK